MYTSHQIACLFRCRPWPGTLQHNGSSSVYSHLSSSNWVFLSLLVFHSVICSYFHPLLSRSLSTFFLSCSDIRHFSTRGDRKNSSSPVPRSFASSTIQLLSSLFSMYLSRDMAGNRSLSSLYALFLSPSITYPFTVTHCALLTEYVE